MGHRRSSQAEKGERGYPSSTEGQRLLEQKAQKDPSRQEPEQRLSGRIDRFTFRNQDTGFAVVRFVPKGAHTGIQLVGDLAQLVEGQEVNVTGRKIVHPKFGIQIQVESIEVSAPTTLDGIQAYLCSDLVKGIGPAMAERLTQEFGQETLRIIEEEPERLESIKGLGKKKRSELVEAIRTQRDVQEVMVFLRSHGLGQNLAIRIVKRLGKDAASRIQANPYRLAEDVFGVGFRTADQLAGKLGIAPDSPDRIQAGIQHQLTQASRDGHCFLPEPDLVAATAQLLNCSTDAIEAEFAPLVAAQKIIRERPPGPPVLSDDLPAVIYPTTLHQAEKGTAQLIERLMDLDTGPLHDSPEKAVEWFEKRSGFHMPAGQKKAIVTALQEAVTVITGGPGVGKTTIIRALVEVLEAEGLEIRLAAPTGRAAKRLSESTGREASTIHRILEFQPGIGRFTRDEKTPLTGDMLVVDEASMIDIQLAYNLLRAVRLGMKLVFVGDIDQLPAVGAGNVLGDLISSGRLGVTVLDEIFRQHKDSHIIRSAHSVLSGEEPTSGPEGSDFFFIESKSSLHTRVIIREVVTQRLPKAFGLDPIEDIQVLCPMYRGEAGADAINLELQTLLNGNGASIERAGRTFRIGDKVMQIRNDYDLDIFNGDTGRIRAIDETRSTLHVSFGDREIEYPFTDLDQLVPAYAISVHRSQGSEYPAVVIPLTNDHFMMLKRNLLYTAITRGKRMVVLVGSTKALSMAVRNHQESMRHSGLADRLRASMRAD